MRRMIRLALYMIVVGLFLFVSGPVHAQEAEIQSSGDWQKATSYINGFYFRPWKDQGDNRQFKLDAGETFETDGDMIKEGSRKADAQQAQTVAAEQAAAREKPATQTRAETEKAPESKSSFTVLEIGGIIALVLVIGVVVVGSMRRR